MKPSQEQIKRLIMSFPCLRSKFAHYDFTQFDSHQVWGMCGPWSHGEILCIQFCLNVWSGDQRGEPFYPFNVLEFLAVADSGNKTALINWIIKPYWP